MNRIILRALDHRDSTVKLGIGGSGIIGRAAQALDAVAPDLSPADRLKVLAIGLFEDQYGMAGTFGGSNNWGAIVGSGDAGSIEHGDTDASGNAYVTNFAAFTTPEKGAARLVQVLRYYGALGVDDDAYTTAKRMFVHPSNGPGHGYYSGHTHKGTKQGTAEDFYERVIDYAKAIKSSADQVASNLGVSKSVTLKDPGSWDGSGTSIGGLLFGGAAMAGLWYFGFGPGKAAFLRLWSL